MARKKSGAVIHKVEQRSEEWHALRRQFPLTASEAQAIATNGKGLETLVWEKMSKRYSSAPEETYTNDDMARGVELEDQARSLYELERDVEVETVGFITNPSVSSVGGASPDGLVNGDGLLEIKCPNDTKFFRMLVEGIVVEPQYEWQMQMQMLFTERKWVDLALYNPNFKESFLVVRVKADKEKQKALIAGLKKGEAIIKEIKSKLTNNHETIQHQQATQVH